MQQTGRVILVVDDDSGVREIVAESLELHGYHVLTANEGVAALALVEQRPEVGLVISDIRMPGLSGLALADRVVAIRAGIRVILISGYFHPQEMKVRFLKKPFTIHQLQVAVEAEFMSTQSG